MRMVYDQSDCDPKDSFGPDWSFATHAISSPSSPAAFGASLALNELNILVVGSPQEGRGAFRAYQYQDDPSPTVPGDWNSQSFGEVIASSPVNSGFASRLALNDDKFLAVAIEEETSASPAGAVHIYEHNYNLATNTHSWTQVFDKTGPAANAWRDVDIDINNKHLAVGAKDAGANGQINVFEYRAGSGWGETSTVPLPYNELRQPTTVAPHCSNPLFLDEGTCRNNGETWIRPAGPLVAGAAANDDYGDAIAFGDDDTLLVGVPGQGANDRGGIRVVKVISDPNFNRDDLLESLLRADCLSKETDALGLYEYEIDDNTKYSCVDIDLRPDLLYFDKVYTDRSLNVLLRTLKKEAPTSEYQRMNQLDIQWVNVDNDGTIDFNTTAYPNFPAFADWQWDAAVMRIQMTVLDVGCISNAPTCEPLGRKIIEDNTKIFYLYPAASAGDCPQELANIDDGDIIQVDCGTENCTFSIQHIRDSVGILTSAQPTASTRKWPSFCERRPCTIRPVGIERFHQNVPRGSPAIPSSINHPSRCVKQSSTRPRTIAGSSSGTSKRCWPRPATRPMSASGWRSVCACSRSTTSPNSPSTPPRPSARS